MYSANPFKAFFIHCAVRAAEKARKRHAAYMATDGVWAMPVAVALDYRANVLEARAARTIANA